MSRLSAPFGHGPSLIITLLPPDMSSAQQSACHAAGVLVSPIDWVTCYDPSKAQSPCSGPGEGTGVTGNILSLHGLLPILGWMALSFILRARSYLLE